MFEQLFQHPHALWRHRAGPLADERCRYLAHLASQGVARKTLRSIANYLVAIAEGLHLNDRPGEAIPRAEIVTQATRWANRQPPPPTRKYPHRTRTRFLGYATRWLQFLGRLQQTPVLRHPFADQINAFANQMQQERGLSPRTIAARCRTAQEFLDGLGAAPQCLREVTAAQIDEVMLNRIHQAGYARVSVQTYVSDVRVFLRYAAANGWCASGLAAALRAPRVYTHESLPVGPSWEQVRQLLATAAGNSPVAIRDRAILLLLAVYGFRAGEVLRLHLEDVDWQRQLLLVTRSKQRRAQTYPLARPVGDALRRYLQEVRPCSVPGAVFLTLRAPFRPLAAGSLWPVVGRRLRTLGITLPHYGPHALRHACATHLLSQGLSLKEIGDHLGHRDPDTTRIYAKVDVVGLRQVANLNLEGLR